MDYIVLAGNIPIGFFVIYGKKICACTYMYICGQMSRVFFLSEATCIMEMSLLMACWKENEFNNALCSSEVQTFFKCAEKAEVFTVELVLKILLATLIVMMH